MHRYFLELAYKGSNYCGWQLQLNAITVQQKLNEALSIVSNQLVESTGCGRTDTGVHALQFFAHFDLKIAITDLEKFIYKLNSLLPVDIAIYNIYSVAPAAHARFDATSRSYRYFISSRKDPFLNETSWFWRSTPDIEKMNNVAALLLNHNDFTCFSKAHGQQATNLCTITNAQWIVNNARLLEFTVTANRFLRGMVRAMVGTMMQVGQQKLSLKEFENILQNGKRSDAGESVPPQGLFLSSIKYPYINSIERKSPNLQFKK